MKKMGRVPQWAPALAAGLVAAALYFSTLMPAVSGCDADYCADVGEFQVALATWGTVHATGYPLYMFIGSPVVAALRQVGVHPAAGASIYSLIWEAAAVAGATLVIQLLTGAPVLAFASGLVLAVFEPVWVHGSLPEVYSLSLLLCVALLGQAVRLRDHWTDGGGWLLAFLGGLGVAHHRLIAILLPAIGLYLLSTAWRRGRFLRWLSVATLCFVAGFVPYLDMPWRVWRGSNWNYGQPATWDGFWFVFWANEARGQTQPILSLPELAGSAQSVLLAITRIVTWPGVILAFLATVLVLRLPGRRPVAGLLLGVLFSYLTFAVVFRAAVLLQADLMPALLALMVLVGLGLCALPRLPRLAGVLGLFLWAGWLVVVNGPIVTSLTRDASAVAYIQQLSQLQAPPGAVVMVPWGWRYFALAYAQRVDGQFSRWLLVDHRADLATLAQTTGAIYTDAATPYDFGVDWWAARLGRPLRIVSAGPRWIELTARPLPGSLHALQPVGDGISVESCAVTYLEQGRQLAVTINWIATTAVDTDYSTYVYASDHDAIVTRDDLVAQSDFSAPVEGWFPTTRWLPGEVVREVHVLDLPPDRTVRSIFVGMYSRDAGGAFTQLGRLHLIDSPGVDCAAQPAPY